MLHIHVSNKGAPWPDFVPLVSPSLRVVASPPCGSRFATPYSYGCLPGSADGGVQSFRSIPLLPGASRPSRGRLSLGRWVFLRKDSKVGLLTGLAPPSSAAERGTSTSAIASRRCQRIAAPGGSPPHPSLVAAVCRRPLSPPHAAALSPRALPLQAWLVQLRRSVASPLPPSCQRQPRCARSFGCILGWPP